MTQRSIRRVSVSSSSTVFVHRHRGLVSMEWAGMGHSDPRGGRQQNLHTLSGGSRSSFNYLQHTTVARFASSTKTDVGIYNDHDERSIDVDVDVEVSSTNASDVPAVIDRFKSVPINLYVDSDVRGHLKMRNSDRKARVYLTKDATADISTLKGLVEKQFAALSQQPYLIRYKLPGVMLQPRPLNTGDDVDLIAKEIMNAGSLQLYIEGKPGVFPPPKEPYLLNMADPAESTHYTMASFYKFHHVEDPEAFSETLFQLWRPFKALGRVYVAKEGLNAQCAIPSNVLHRFKQASETLDMFSSGMYLNTDHELTRTEYESNPAFKNLHIRVRSQIVADGFDEPLDWDTTGREIAPKDWHRELENPEAIILDCRNSYESEIGKFENAIPLNTTFFRESWDALQGILQDKPKDAPIMTYCTGGIRCVKINAYLQQEMGFTNVGRLEGGIISYTKELERSSLDRSAGTIDGDKPIHLSRDVGGVSKFKGMNYVFDERMGARITADILSQCETCGAECDLFKNCENYDCHIRFIQCEKCIRGYKGCCCVACEKKYDGQVEVENKFLSEEANRRKVKLQRDRDLIPTPRKRAAMAVNGVTKKQLMEAEVSSASKVIHVPAEEGDRDNEKHTNEHQQTPKQIESGASEVVSDDIHQTTAMNGIGEKINGLENSIHDLKRIVVTDQQAVTALEKQIIELKEQSIKTLEERLVSKTQQILTEVAMEESRQFKELQKSVHEYKEAGVVAIDKLAAEQKTSLGETESLRTLLDTKVAEIGKLKNTIHDLQVLQESQDEKIASIREKELRTKREQDQILRAKEEEKDAMIKSMDEMKSRRQEKDEQITQLHSTIESLTSSLAEEQEKATLAKQEEKKLEEEAQGFKDHAHSLDERLGALSTYTERYSSPEPELLHTLRNETIDAYGINAARMVSGHLQGRILKLIASMTGAKRVLELGTFTGYASLCLAEGMKRDAYSEDPLLVTCEPDAKAIEIARRFFKQSPLGTIIDSRKMNAEALMDLLRKDHEKFDIVFIDADKRAYKEYLATVLGSTNGVDGNIMEIDPEKSLLADGGIVIIDNTLWKGLVMYHEEELRQFSPTPEEFGKAARMEKLAAEMHDFNAFARRICSKGGMNNVNKFRDDDTDSDSSDSDDDSEMEQSSPSADLVLLPLRDGLTILQLNGHSQSKTKRGEGKIQESEYEYGRGNIDKRWKIQF